MAKNVELLSVTTPREVLYPRTVSDVVNVSDTKNLTQKLSELDAEFKRYLPLTGGALTGNLTVPMFIGSLNGNASSASKLQTGRTLTIGNAIRTFDGTGNLTWLLTDIGALALTGGTITGNLTINGNLTSGGMTAPNNMWLTTDNGDIIVQFNTASGNASGVLRSYRNATDDFGDSSHRWRNIWASNGTIQTSDERYKNDIQDIDDEQFFEMVKGVSVNTYVMLEERKDKITKSALNSHENKQATASSERVQVGIIAQEMAQFDCGKYILVHDEETDIYSVNNYNFTSALMGALKVEISKRESLEERVAVLEELLMKKVA